MKNGETIVHTILSSNPKWRSHRAIRALLSPLPQNMRDAVLSARIDGATLVLKVTSHAMKSEYYNKRDQILGIYKILRRETRHFEGIELNSVKLFVDHNSDFLPKPRKDETYSERARGRFENTAENRVIFEAIERLRETIKKNADN